MTKDGAIQHQGTAEKALTRARESEVAVDTGRTGGLGHTRVASWGNSGKRTRRGAARPDEEGEIMSQYELDRKRRKKENEDFMRSLGIEMGVSASKRTTADNRRRRQTSVGVVSDGTARVGRTIRTQSAEPRDAEHACLLGKEGRSIQGSGEDGDIGGVRKGGGGGW